MTIFAVRHQTIYRYRKPVRFGEHRLMFRPRDSFDQRLLSASLQTDPGPPDIRWMHDVFGNCVALVTLPDRAAELRFETNIRLDHTPQAAPAFRMADRARLYPFAYEAEEMPDLAALIAPQFPDEAEEVGRWARRFLRKGRRTETGVVLMTLCCAIQESFAYVRRSAPGVQAPGLTLRLGRGTCRDFALLMVEAARALGFAARFVSGYVFVPSRDGSLTRGGGSTHAWAQVYLPGAGWVEFDPTNGIVGNRDLIRVAVARDPGQAVPLSGSYFGPASAFLDMDVQVNVSTEPSHEAGTADQKEAAAPQRESALYPSQAAAAMPPRLPQQGRPQQG